MADPKAKRSSRGEYGTIKCGASSLQADHKEMQDAVSNIALLCHVMGMLVSTDVYDRFCLQLQYTH